MLLFKIYNLTRRVKMEKENYGSCSLKLQSCVKEKKSSYYYDGIDSVSKTGKGEP